MVWQDRPVEGSQGTDLVERLRRLELFIAALVADQLQDDDRVALADVIGTPLTPPELEFVRGLMQVLQAARRRDQEARIATLRRSLTDLDGQLLDLSERVEQQ